MAKVLNLYAGIGGNRKLWDDVDVTAIEYDPEIAEVYEDNFPNDEVIVADAHEYLKNHYDEGWDFVWSSPPCPTHSQMNRIMINSDAIQNESREFEYPDMRLYQEIILLKRFFDNDYVVENVVSYYDPLIQPLERGRHYFWTNFYIPKVEMEDLDIKANYEHYRKMHDFTLSGYDIKKDKKVKMLRNCVHPDLGRHVFNARKYQSTLPETIV